VVYRPEAERLSHYFSAGLPAHFDVVLHFDEARDVKPLERTAQWDEGEQPETYHRRMRARRVLKMGHHWD